MSPRIIQALTQAMYCISLNKGPSNHFLVTGLYNRCCEVLEIQMSKEYVLQIDFIKVS